MHFLDLLQRRLFPYFCILILLGALEQFLGDHDPFRTAGCFQRRILGIPAFVAKDGAQQLFSE